MTKLNNECTRQHFNMFANKIHIKETQKINSNNKINKYMTPF